ncbi:MAG TPA: hypothetical protein VMH35_09005 [Streptosporangiaceae bacterium]|nr:hypothetical protein [Streptosporangiaceae bacterium]
MPVLLLLAGAVILAGVVAVAMGHGGEMAQFPSDYVPPKLGDLLTAADVAVLRPPSALWGYNTQVTNEALTRIAHIVTERDVEIAVLRQQLAELRSGGGARPQPAAPVTVAQARPADVTATGPAPHGAAPAEPAAEADRGRPDADAEPQEEAAPVQAAPSDEVAAPGDG